MLCCSPKALRSLIVALSVSCALVPGAGAAESRDLKLEDVQQQKQAHEKELTELTHNISISEERKAEIERTIRAIDRDREALNSELIQTGQRTQQLEDKMAATEARLLRHRTNENNVRKSLHERRGTLTEVLVALQRIGHSPPPALAVRPKDALGAVRTAILLNAVVPEVKFEAEALASDLARLQQLRKDIETERKRIRRGAVELEEEREKLEILLAEKQRQKAETNTLLAEEKKRAAELAKKATSLKELLVTLESQIGSAKKAAEAARLAELEREKKRKSGDPFADPGRLQPQISFSDAKGMLPLPVSGTLLQDFGIADGFGNRTNGQTYMARANAQITSPTDGWVAFAGEFRSYGQLIIVNAGNGYHVVLAGMDQISVELGQFVLAGEPIAKMGDKRFASAANLNLSSELPVLYVEFRKDGTAVDPRSWWATSNIEKVRG
ncbi:murein hydrolase activator EnvC family protein [Flexibacterium corallicola]|uniref:murein hydrolase activator EnvC family protein n=1 Tax=Flexibacterium corallicola TaxID=3037259 RepID=UPI00286F29C6|nr:peptidoglycan DD-metalloendopeptidase family protein [Pseudovibrio sp. M1P-2-3]